MDLHSGLPYWIVRNSLLDYFHPLEDDLSTDIVIVGSGITGALMAHELCRAGIECCVIDKRSIATGSSAASTALLQYEIDVPLCRMAKIISEENAATAYHACLQSISDIKKVLKETDVDAGFEQLSSVFYASCSADNKLLEQEYEIRQKHELPVNLLKKQEIRKRYKVKVPGNAHPGIRSVSACYASSELAIRLARIAGARLHILHVSTSKELKLFSSEPLEDKNITSEACVAHLLYTLSHYNSLGARIKCNPAIKRKTDREALRAAVNSGLIDVIATDHAPHLLSEKEGGALKAMSGMPMIQFSLVSMLGLVDEGIFSLETLVQKMCHAPAQIYGICRRGYIREGYQADLVLVRPNSPWEVTSDKILSKCGWSPLEGHTFNWKVEKTFANGHLIYNGDTVDGTYRGEELRFDYRSSKA